MKKIILFIPVTTLLIGCTEHSRTPPIVAPFTALDTLATNDWWNRGSNPIIYLKENRDSDSLWIVYCIQYYFKA